MGIDPTGYQAALAEIKPGQLSERQQRIAAGLAMIREGKSVRAASKATMIPWATLDRYNKGLSTLESNEAGAEVNVEHIHHAASDIALIAAQHVLESLRDHSEEWKPGDFIKAFGVAADKVIALSGRTRPTETGMSALGQLLSGATLTFPAAGQGERTLDVDAERIG